MGYSQSRWWGDLSLELVKEMQTKRRQAQAIGVSNKDFLRKVNNPVWSQLCRRPLTEDLASTSQVDLSLLDRKLLPPPA